MIAIVDECATKKTYMDVVFDFYDVDGYGQMAVLKGSKFSDFLKDNAVLVAVKKEVKPDDKQQLLQ